MLQGRSPVEGTAAAFFHSSAFQDADEDSHFCYETILMMSVRTVGMGTAVTILVFAALIGASPGCAQSQAPEDATSASSESAPDTTALTATAVSPEKKTLGQKVKALV